ncbi:lipid II:glycine glycyltransferase FemX [Micrococcus sp.]|uniref:lipid II:glycine glycyltransferase FemX n=1 Tax=Micrococcus sp. TaxID=1271 RepID=UPI002A91873C|nr:peptidoglycan bridge formation glycyltransferase FemA/FemB family protein [Micrococcus sp.]MDY6055156.1 peptidoglycan bridge formation glycyltransferase FemA/FemB family protein [Micrococcus sp.]
MVSEAPDPRPAPSPAAGSVSVRPISRDEHEELLRRHPEASFLQNPAWAAVKSGWRAQSLGFETAGRLVGAALVLYRAVPVPRWVPVLGSASLAYITEGPVLDDGVRLRDALPPLVEHLRREGAFEVRLGPPGVVRRWAADDVRKALKDPEYTSLMDLQHDLDAKEVAVEEDLRALGWRAPAVTEEFIAGQPMFQARIPLEGLDVDGVLKRMNQTSRSETRKSTRTELTIRRGGVELLEDFHGLYTETAAREGFNGRAQPYFERVVEAMDASALSEAEVFVASHEGRPLAGAITLRQGHFAWYPYGGSSLEERKRFAPRALQLEQITAAVEAGCHWYDLGGVSSSLRQDHKLAGLTLFKTAMGADLIQTHGEWTLPLRAPLAKAFELYMSRR